MLFKRFIRLSSTALAKSKKKSSLGIVQELVHNREEVNLKDLSIDSIREQFPTAQLMKNAWNVDSLKEFCKLHKLPYYGTKTQMVDRIRSYCGLSKLEVDTMKNLTLDPLKAFFVTHGAFEAIKAAAKALNVSVKASPKGKELTFTGNQYSVNKTIESVNAILSEYVEDKIESSGTETEHDLWGSISRCFIESEKDKLVVKSLKHENIECLKECIKLRNHQMPEIGIRSSQDDIGPTLSFYPTTFPDYSIYFKRNGCFRLMNSSRFAARKPSGFEYTKFRNASNNFTQSIKSWFTNLNESNSVPIICFGEAIWWDPNSYISNPFIDPLVKKVFTASTFSKSQEFSQLTAGFQKRPNFPFTLGKNGTQVSCYEIQGSNFKILYALREMTLEFVTAFENQQNNWQVILNPHFQYDFQISFSALYQIPQALPKTIELTDGDVIDSLRSSVKPIFPSQTLTIKEVKMERATVSEIDVFNDGQQIFITDKIEAEKFICLLDSIF